MKFTGSNVLITGASKGIGAQIAKTLASFGLKVWINYRSGAEAAEAIKEEIEKAGGKIHTPKMSIGEHGFITLFSDTEGNMVGLHSMK